MLISQQLCALKCLSDVLDHAHKNKISLQALVSDAAAASPESELRRLIRTAAKDVRQEQLRATGLERGIATIPLAGIDVPFHSSYLKAGVASFRRHLYEKISQTSLDLDRLIGKYVPNLTAAPFEISRAYFETVSQLTGSKVVGDVIQRVRNVPHSFLRAFQCKVRRMMMV
jgi:fatty acid synthase subunit beta, fungi type